MIVSRSLEGRAAQAPDWAAQVPGWPALMLDWVAKAPYLSEMSTAFQSCARCRGVAAQRAR
jgi:hypothetical protein